MKEKQKVSMDRKADNFSHRSHTTDSILDAQFKIAWEGLIRENYPRLIRELQTVLVPRNSEEIMQRSTAQKNMNTLFEALGCEDIVVGSTANYEFYDYRTDTERIVVTDAVTNILGVGKNIVVYARVQVQENAGNIAVIGVDIDFICPNSMEIDLSKYLEDTPLEIYAPNPNGDNVVPVKFAFYDRVSARISENEIDRLPFSSVEQNYAPDSANAYHKMIKSIQEANHGLVILNGPPGTGKSYMVRAMLSDIRERRGIVCSPAYEFLHDVSALAKIVERHKRSIIVLEDFGVLAESDAITFHSAETSNLLNLSEGLLSLMSDTIFVLTFNYDLSHVNPALLRPGRCLGVVSTKPLLKQQAQDLTGMDSLPKSSYTLAEVYEILRTGDPTIDESRLHSIGKDMPILPGQRK
jgi:hypothetical protein